MMIGTSKGIDPKTLTYDFHQVRAKFATTAGKTVHDPEGRFLAHPVGQAWLNLMLHEYARKTWEFFGQQSSWLHVDPEVMYRVFTFEECARLWSDACISSRVCDDIEKNHMLLWKLRNAHWRYTMAQDWNLLVRHMEGLKRLSWGMPDFEVRLVHSRKYNTCGYSVQIEDLYLDASFGLAVYYKDEHVLTVGFAPTEHGILIAQVQLKKHKGNRFLYKLPKHYVECAVDVFHRAFPDDQIYLVEGYSAAEAARLSHGPKGPDYPWDADRIASVYNPPLLGYTPGVGVREVSGRVYIPLDPYEQRLAA